jgi:hypothetical protein
LRAAKAGPIDGLEEGTGVKTGELLVSYLAVVGLIHAQRQAAGVQQGQQQER